jgi:hypothetical protein
MSDTHEHDEHKTEQSHMPDPDYVVGHSGERVVEEFDNTPLEEAPVHPVPDTVNEFVTLQPTRQEKKSRGWLKPVAAFVGVVVVGIGAYVALGQSEGDSPEPNNAPEAEVPVEEPATEQPVEENPDTSNVNLGELEPGTNFVTATRLNGEEIRVPRLDNSSPESFANTALSLWACYDTTGSQECLNALSPDSEVQALLRSGREEFIVPQLEIGEISRNGQVIIYDTTEDPAQFQSRTAESGLEVVELTGGSLYYKFFLDITSIDKNKWQTEDAIQVPGPVSQFTVLKFFIDSLEDGTPTVAGIEFNFEEA